MADEEKRGFDRRSFLRGFGGVSTAAAAAIVTAGTDEAEAYDPDSPDVQAFYRTNGYETLRK